jgi:hypothetical protein
MHGKLLGLVTVADGEGREFDLGELVTYVNDAAMLAPSMLLTASATRRVACAVGAGGGAGLYRVAIVPADLVMSRQMLHGVKARTGGPTA